VNDQRNFTLPTLEFEEVFFGFLVALASGALIGIEREQSQALKNKPHLGGVRTFPLIALAGALAGLAVHGTGMWPVLMAMLVLGSLLVVDYYQQWRRDEAPGVTTEIAALITFLLGVLAVLPGVPIPTGQRYLLIISSAAVVMALLSYKEPLHHAVERFSVDDMYATARFVILALVILPLLPNRTYGPFQVLNPFNIGLMVVLIAAVSFVGYILTRAIGAKLGLTLTGMLGGLVSSTAVTVSLSSKARQSGTLVLPAVIAMVIAWSTMFVRILVIVGIVDRGLLRGLWSLGIMALAGYATALVFYLRSSGEMLKADAVRLRNPFELGWALRFGLFYALVIFVSKAAQDLLGDQGLYVAAFFAGLADVDAIALSIARFHQEGLAVKTAVTAIIIAAVTNTIVKAGIAVWVGGRRLALQPTIGALVILFAGGLGFLLV
jgi:uncharacterized membrane protein (DUF4010 family)